MLKIALIVVLCVLKSFGQCIADDMAKNKKKEATIANVNQTSLRGLSDLVISDDGREVIVSGKDTVLTDSEVYTYVLIWRRGSNGWTVQKLDGLRGASKMQWKDSQTGWVGPGEILLTLDGGKSWRNVADEGREFFFLNREWGWYVDYDNELKATDGKSKKDFSTFGSSVVKKIKFVSSEIGWIHTVNDGKPELVETRDGGKTWDIIDHPAARRVEDFQLFNENEGYLITSNRVFRTRDGGGAWEDLGLRRGIGLEKVFFLDSLHGWVVGDNTCFTADGGRTWRCAEVPCSMVENAIQEDLVFANPREGWLLTTQGLYGSRDGGMSWFRESLVYQGKRF